LHPYTIQNLFKYLFLNKNEKGGQKMGKNILDWIAIILVVVGGLNWGLFGLLGIDLVDYLAPVASWLPKVVYILVGVATLYLIYYLFKEKNY
jgi:uncharacterized protein